MMRAAEMQAPGGPGVGQVGRGRPQEGWRTHDMLPLRDGLLPGCEACLERPGLEVCVCTTWVGGCSLCVWLVYVVWV